MPYQSRLITVVLSKSGKITVFRHYNGAKMS